MKFYFSNHHKVSTPKSVDKWYDRYTRSWVVQLKDQNGFQIGDAYYCGSRVEAETEENRLKGEYKL